MSDPDTRSVAEIIGLTSCEGEPYVHGRPEPTPDDMLAWLVGQGLESVHLAPRRGGDGSSWFASVLGGGFDWNADDDPDILYHTPSAALEAAVRAVAGEEA